MTRACRVLVVCVLAACGDNQPPPPSGPPTVTLTVPNEAAPGSQVTLHVDVTNVPAGDTLEVLAVAPGQPLAPDLPRFIAPGVAPATGAMSWLGPDGTLTTTRVAYTATPTSGDVVLSLPDATAGVWSFAAILRGPADTLDVIAHGELIASAKPALALSLDGIWSAVSDPVHARVQIARAGRSDLALIAWLTTPDGGQLALPTLTPYLTTTAARDDRVQLLDQTLEAYGSGTFGIDARLVDTTTNEVIGAGAAALTTCTTAGHLTGLVRDHAGAQLGAGATLANVTLIPLFDSQDGGGAEIAADGTFGVDLPVGAWAVGGVVEDAAGRHAIAYQTVQVGCTGNTALELTAAEPVPIAARRAHVRTAPIDPPPVGCPRTTQASLLVKLQRNGAGGDHNLSVPADKLDPFLDDVRKRIQMQNPGLYVANSNDMRSFLDDLQRNALLGTDGPTLFANLQFQLSYDFTQLITIVDNLDGKNVLVSMVLTDANGDLGFGNVSGVVLPKDLSPLLPKVDQMATGLLAQLLPHTESPRSPEWGRASIYPSLPVVDHFTTVSVALTDKCGTVAPGRPIEFREVAAFPSLIPGTKVAITDDTGIAKLGLAAPHTPTPARFEMTYTRRNGYPIHSTLVTEFRAPSEMNVTADHVQLRVTERARGTIHFRPNTMVALAASIGVVSPSAVTTDGSGVASFTYTAPSHAGLGHVTAESLIPFAPQGPYLPLDNPTQEITFWIEAPLTITVDAAPAPATTTNESVLIVATAVLSPSEPAVGMPITFSVAAGGGSVEFLTLPTDANGHAGTLFRAPALAGTSTVKAAGSLGSFPASGTIEIDILDPCPACPVAIATTPPTQHIPKGGTVRFVANQPVRWSATGGSIAPNGTFTAGEAGGIWTVTANATQSAQQGSATITVDCAESELGLAHVPTMSDIYGGGKDYAVTQTVSVADPLYTCSTVGSGPGTLRLYAPAYWSMTNSIGLKHVDVALMTASGGPSEVPCARQLNDSTFPPVLDGCTITFQTNPPILGCRYDQLAITVTKGPGIAGLGGSYTRNRLDVSNACVVVEQTDFTSP